MRGNSGRGTGQEEGLAGKWKIEFAAFLPLPPSLFALWAVKENLFNLPRSAYSREQAARQQQRDATNPRASFAKETDKLEEDRANTDSSPT